MYSLVATLPGRMLWAAAGSVAALWQIRLLCSSTIVTCSLHLSPLHLGSTLLTFLSDQTPNGLQSEHATALQPLQRCSSTAMQQCQHRVACTAAYRQLRDIHAD
eukprot:GHUV01036946.1.p2 GENE.GHUV01036946.1~~GHUV01036946.1.p2  ORF type:complete len:104 (-),score=20.60 GHUV01036946.1:291-602(-)